MVVRISGTVGGYAQIAGRHVLNGTTVVPEEDVGKPVQDVIIDKDAAVGGYFQAAGGTVVNSPEVIYARAHGAMFPNPPNPGYGNGPVLPMAPVFPVAPATAPMLVEGVNVADQIHRLLTAQHISTSNSINDSRTSEERVDPTSDGCDGPIVTNGSITTTIHVTAAPANEVTATPAMPQAMPMPMPAIVQHSAVPVVEQAENQTIAAPLQTDTLTVPNDPVVDNISLASQARSDRRQLFPGIRAHARRARRFLKACFQS
ncbi:hypothetical protein CC1G_14790 [Coprinopsis cinerea okayama7|uniref:Uncharacterized protein n=1 Tax=Coprinopsis cinerea (strain Okayama-7 / 130 / ATCC MYA-4618 / FGSC 9003) TaxID=240176 RepID=D6RNH1_COPC7|nr:hypothetical protein CC1G_14790 [Coprinopsis cinerea okayama7\|eukprot:XP_002910812.1 hypothetical protein CC1G_14790 [Coprinopsis cinerea okayama7\